MYPQLTLPLLVRGWVRNHRHLLPPLLLPLIPPPFRTNFLARLVSKVCPECPDARPTSLALGPRPPSRARNARPESMIGATRGWAVSRFLTRSAAIILDPLLSIQCARSFKELSAGPRWTSLTNKKTFPSISPSPAFFSGLDSDHDSNMVWSSIPTMGFTVLLDSELNPHRVPVTIY